MIFGSVLAAGQGSRMRSYRTPKQFIEICGRPIVAYTLERLLAAECFDCIIVAAHPDYVGYLSGLCADIAKSHELSSDLFQVMSGGGTRIESIECVIRKLRECGGADDDIVLIHDAVRPFVSTTVLHGCIGGARECGASIAAIPASDTMLVSLDGRFLHDVPDRHTILHGQAPDAFRVKVIGVALAALTAEERSYITGTSQICFAKGYKVRVVPGDERNFKITTQADLER